MDSVTVPPDVVTTLRAAGYAVRGPAGVGAGGPVWTATGPSGARLAGRVVVHAVTVPAGAAGAALVRRLDALRDLEHPHVARVVDVLALGTAPARRAPGAPLLVLVDEVPGTTLGALLAARGPMPAGEVVTLVVPLAGALDALHRVGLVHGDVSPGNVVVRPDGRPVLIDLLGTPRRTGDRSAGHGTPGFVAPEVAGDLRRRRGEPEVAGAGAAGPDDPAATPTSPAGAPADVYGLATVALAALEPAASDGPLGRELTAACHPDPVLRPTAAQLAARCWARAAATPVRLPDPAVLARTTLAQLAAEDRTVSVDARGARHRAPRRGAPRRWAALAGALVVAASAGLALHGPPGAGPPDAPSRTAAVDATVTAPGRRPDPVGAAVALTRRRAEVLVGGDPAALVDVVREGGAAHAADLDVMRRLAASGVRLEGLGASTVTARPVPGVDRWDGAGDRVDVAVTSSVTAHRRRAPDGVVEVPAQPSRTVVLTLAWTPDGWRVDAVRAP